MEFTSLKNMFLENTRNNYISNFNFIDFEKNINITFDDLYWETVNLANVIHLKNVKEKEFVLIQIKNPYYFIIAFWSIILNDSIPALYPIVKNDEDIKNLEIVCKDFNINNIIIDKNIHTLINSSNILTNKLINIENKQTLKKEKLLNLKYKILKNEDNLKKIALIQFSSGSTSKPKGVLLTNENILSNISSTAKAFELTSKDKCFNWLPLTHDFGMIVMHIMPIYKKLPQVISEPTFILRKPNLWFDVIKKYEVTFIPLPNFAMNHINNHFDEVNQKSDLSSVRVIITSGEGISVKTCYKFINNCKNFNLQKNTLFTAYGLAEACAGVTILRPKNILKYCCIDAKFDEIGEKVSILYEDTIYNKPLNIKENEKLTISCGSVTESLNIWIENERGERLSEKHIGLIKVSGTDVMKGYYKTKNSNNVLNDKRELDTGDIGFIYRNELYVTGRKKHIIILNGHNYFSFDIENLIYENIKGKTIFEVAAFSTEIENQESLIIAIVCELKNFEHLKQDIQNILIEKLNLAAKKIMYCNEIPKTTSGKIKYFLLKKELSNLIVEDSNNLKQIKKIIEKELKRKINKNEYNLSLQQLGVDSLSMEYLCCVLEQKFNIHLYVDEMQKHSSLKELTKLIDTKQKLLKCDY